MHQVLDERLKPKSEHDRNGTQGFEMAIAVNLHSVIRILLIDTYRIFSAQSSFALP